MKTFGNLFIFFCVAFGLFLIYNGLTAPEPTSAAQAAPVGLMFSPTQRPKKYTPVPTATQTETAVPTPPAWMATEGAIKLAAAQVELDTANVANETAKLGYAATQNSIQLTQEQEGENIRATDIASTPTAEALATLGAVKFNVAVTQVYAGATATEQNRSVLATAVYNEVTTKNVGQGVNYGLWALLAVFVAFLVGRYFSARTAEVNERRALIAGVGEPPNARTQPAPQAPNTLVLDRREPSGMGAVDISECPIDAQTLQSVAELVILSHRRYTEGQMTGKGNPLTKDGTFDTFGEWMKKHGVATQNPESKVYNIVNTQFFERLLS